MYLIEYAQFCNRIFTGWVDAGQRLGIIYFSPLTSGKVVIYIAPVI